MEEREGRPQTRYAGVRPGEARPASAPPTRTPTPTTVQRPTSYRAFFLDLAALVRPADLRARRSQTPLL